PRPALGAAVARVVRTGRERGGHGQTRRPGCEPGGRGGARLGAGRSARRRHHPPVAGARGHERA
ncbi:hypothetical protein FRC96_14305, partial [Lujinxingia vulgaris]